MIKLAANAFLMTRISFINEIANVCEASAPTSTRSRRASASTTGSARTSCAPGSATAARCFPKDSLALKQLAANSGYHFQLLTAVIEVNELQKRRVIAKLEQHLGSLRGKTSRCSGSRSSRTRTTCARRRASCSRAASLAEGAEVRALGSGRRRRARCSRASSIADSVSRPSRGADAAVIVTEWPELRDARRARRCAPRCAPADRRRAQPARPGRGARGGLRLRGHRSAASPLGRAARDGRARADELELAERGGDHPRGRQGRAARRRGGRTAEGARPGRGHAARRVPGRAARAAGVDARDRRAAPPAREPSSSESSRPRAARSCPPEEPEPLGRGGGLKFAARQRAARRGRFRAERRRAPRRRPARCSRATGRPGRPRRSPSRSCVAVRRRRARRRRRRDGLQRGAAAPVLGQLRRATSSTTRRSSACPSAATTSDDVPRARGRGQAARLPPRGPLADRQHAEGAAPRGGLRRRAPRVVGASRSGVGSAGAGVRLARTSSSLDRLGFEPRRVDKPWGYELIWALTEQLRRQAPLREGGRVAQPPVPPREGRVLVRPVRAGEARARRGGRRGPDRGDRRAGAAFRFTPGTVHRVTRSRTRRSSRSRRRSSTTSSGSRTLRPRGHLRTLTHLC